MIREIIALFFFLSALAGAHITRGFAADCMSTYHANTPKGAKADDLASFLVMGGMTVLGPLCIGLLVLGVFR